MNIKETLKDAYQIEGGIYVPEQFNEGTVWDTLATNDLLDAATSATSEEHAVKKGEEQIQTLLEGAPHGVILDVGCGYGRIAEQLLPKRAFDAYIGIDSSLSMLSFALKRKKERGGISTPMYFVYGEIDALPLADSSVDVVVVSAVFLHNHKSVTAKSIEEIYRVLKPGGVLYVFSSFPNLSSLMGIQVWMYLSFLKVFGDEYRNGPVRYFRKSEVEHMHRSFRHVDVIPFGFTVLPKRILVFPRFLNSMYMRYLANPVNAFLSRLIPTSGRRFCATHHDVIAIK